MDYGIKGNILGTAAAGAIMVGATPTDQAKIIVGAIVGTITIALLIRFLWRRGKNIGQ